MQRPSHKELFGKLREAKKAVRASAVFIINQEAVACDAIELGYVVDLELIDVLTELLETARPSDYTGSHPPQQSYAAAIEGLELFAFTVESTRFRCRVYLKFALADDALWLVSLHLDRSKKEAT